MSLDGEIWTLTVRAFDVPCPERTITVNYDGFSEGRNRGLRPGCGSESCLRICSSRRGFGLSTIPKLGLSALIYAVTRIVGGSNPALEWEELELGTSQFTKLLKPEPPVLNKVL